MESFTPKSEETGQLTIETLDEVAPRLRGFTQELIQNLLKCGVHLEYSTSFLLNSTDHPIEVPCRANGIPVAVGWEAVFPVWDTFPRASISLRFEEGFVYRYVETKRRKFPLQKVTRRFLLELHTHEQRRGRQESKQNTRELAATHFEQLAKELGVSLSTEDPSVMVFKNSKIKRIDNTPCKVVVLLNVDHAQALEIIKKYGAD